MRSSRLLFVILPALLLIGACSQQQPADRRPPQPVQSAATGSPVHHEVATAGQQVEKEASRVEEDAEQVAAKVGKEADSAAADTASAVEKTLGKAEKDVAAALDNQQTAPPEAAKAPDTVVYPGPRGKVVFTHAIHAARLDCGRCHTHDPPEKIAINREVAHTLCRGCHQESGGHAPLYCSGCHKK